MSLVGVLETIALIPTSILFIVLLSEYVLILFSKKKYAKSFYPSISLLVPAFNEEKNIEGTLNSIFNSKYKGNLEVIVINDGSTDNTGNILKEFYKKKKIRLIETNHVGKSKALNHALKIAKNEIVVVMDADSEIRPDALRNIVRPFTDENVGAVSGIVRVKNRKKPLAWFQNLEYSYFSFYNSICEKINAVIFTPGVLSAYRKKLLQDIGGFSAKTLVEDCDVALKIHRMKKKIVIADDVISYTVVPESIKDFFRQRIRWAKGVIQVLRLNIDFLFNKRYKGVGFYSLPLLSYWYVHAILMGVIIFYQIFWGYYNYFFVYGNGFSFDALKYFVYWFSFFGIINLIYQISLGNIAASPLISLSIAITFLSYGFYLMAFLKYEKRISIKEIFVLLFYFPYILLILIIQALGTIEVAFPSKRMYWEK